MKKVFDYAGNEIKEGDEFVIVQVLDTHIGGGYIINETEYKFDKVPDRPCFEIGEYFKVINKHETMNELGYCINGVTYTFYNTILSMITYSNLNSLPRTAILAIKGISDTKEYYDTWKKKRKE